MNDSGSNSRGTSSPSPSQQTAEVRGRFESAWQAGDEPDIVHFLNESGAANRPALLQELLRIELHYRSQSGETMSRERYHKLFPDYVDLVDSVFQSSQADGNPPETLDWSVSSTHDPRKSDGGADAELAAKRFGRFELLSLLGRGGFGSVYRARDPQLHRDLALKFPRAGALVDEDDVQRFMREARAAAQLRHPNIVPVFEAGEIDGAYFIASSFVPGKNLRAEIKDKKGKFTLREAAGLIAKLAEALHYAHNKGIIHRDVKPENVMIDEAGEPHVMDFGLARREQGEELLTQEGALMGTPAYMSPEQAKGESHLADARSDLWALGVMLYELLTGRRPFVGQAHALLNSVLEDVPDPPRKLNKSVSRDLETICLKCLEKDPARRYASCQHLADELNRWLRGDPIEARRMPAPERALRWTARHPVLAGAALLLLVASSAFAVYWQSRPAYLDLRVAPTDARVTIDGRPIETDGGQALIADTAGRHTLEIAADGYVERIEDVILARGRGNAVVKSVELESIFGHLQVDSIPAGAAVEVIDATGPVVARGATPFHSPRLPAGNYTLRFSKDLYKPTEVTAEVPNGDRVNTLANVRLETEVQGAESLDQLQRLRGYLTQPLTEPWEFQGTPLSEVADQISAKLGITVALDRRALATVGISPATPVTFSYRGGTVQSAFALMLDQLGLTLLPLDIESDKRQFLITTPEETESKLVVVIYPVKDLVAGGAGVGVTYDYDSLTDQITSTIAPATWDEVGGPGSISAGGIVPTLTISQTWPVHFQIIELLTNLRQVQAMYTVSARPEIPIDSPSLADLRRLQAMLQRPLAQPWQFRETPLHEAVQQIAQWQNVDILLDERSLEEIGVATSTPVTFQAANESFGDALAKLTETLELTFTPIDFRADDVQFQVTTNEERERRNVMVTFPVRDLVEGSDQVIDGDGLLEDIFETIEPESWDAVGGPGSINYVSSQQALVISQQWDVQLDVLQFLTKLRERVGAGSAIAATGDRRLELSPAERRMELLQLQREFASDDPRTMPNSDVAGLRNRVVAFFRDHHGTPEGIAAFQMLARLEWPVDRFQQANISQQQLSVAGGGDAERVPPDLVHIFGDGRLKHWASVYDVAFSPDGKTIATASEDCSVKLWDSATYELQQSLLGHSDDVQCVAFSPDGTAVVSASADKSVRVWDLSTGESLLKFSEHVGPVQAVCFSPDGSFIASAGADLVIRVWDAKTGQSRATLSGHSATVTCLEFVDDRLLLSGSEDQTARLWDVASKSTKRVSNVDFAIRAVAVSPDKQKFAIGGDGIVIRIEQLEAAHDPLSIVGRDKAGWIRFSHVRGLAFSTDGRHLAAASQGNVVCWLDATTGETKSQSFPSNQPAYAAAIRPGGGTLATAHYGGSVKLWDTTAAEFGNLRTVFGDRWIASAEPPSHDAWVLKLSFRPDGQSLTSVGGDQRISFWNLSSGKSEHDMFARTNWMHSTDFSGDGSQFATTDGSGRVTIWDREQRREKRTLGGSEAAGANQFQQTGNVAVSADARFVASADYSGMITVWDATTGARLQTLENGPTGAMAFSPDNSTVAAVSSNQVNVWGVREGNMLRTLDGHHRAVRAVAFDRGGARIATGGWDGVIGIWDAHSGELIHRIQTRGGVYAVAFNPTGDLLASGHARGTVHLWDAKLGTQWRRWTLAPPSGVIWDVEFSPEGRHLATANGNGTIYILRLPERTRSHDSVLISTPEPAPADGDLTATLAAADGMLDGRFALCQTLSLDKFSDVYESLQTHGYRPLRIRPFSDADNLKVAALWSRDGLPHESAMGLTPKQLDSENSRLAQLGYCPVDVAGYVDIGQVKYAAAWVKDQRDPATMNMYFGVDAAEHERRWKKLRDDGYEPLTNQIFHDQDGVLRRNLVWWKTGRSAGFLQGSLDLLDSRVTVDRFHQEIGLAESTLDGKPAVRYSFCYLYDVDAVSVTRYGLSPAEHLDQSRQLASRGYQPAAVAVCRDPTSNKLVAASVWQRDADRLRAVRP